MQNRAIHDGNAPLAAVEEVLEAAQHTAVDRLHLYLVELQLDAMRWLRSASLGVVGVTALLLGWILLLAALALALQPFLGGWVGLASVGASQCLLGGVLVWLGSNAHQKTRSTP